MSIHEDYLDRSSYEDEGLCPCCHRPATDTVDREDGHHYLRCSCGRTHFEYDEEDAPELEKPQCCESCEDADAVFAVKIIRVDNDGVSSSLGTELDFVYLCEDCARDENWHVNKDGKLECE